MKPIMLRPAVAGIVLAALSACGDQPAQSSLPAVGDNAALVGTAPTLLRCTPLAADSVSVTVGPAGAAITVGPHLLTVPEGALASSVTITAIAPSDTVRRVEFQPDGLVFATPAELRMSYAACEPAGSLLPKRIVQISEALDVLTVLPSLDLGAVLTTSAALPHFSGYAVAW